MPSDTPVIAVLLAGGASSRFGSDKREAMFRKRRLWTRQYAKLRNTGFPVVIAADRADIFTTRLHPGTRMVLDGKPHAGPLTALAGVVKAIPAGAYVVLGVDLPLVPLHYLQWLAGGAAHGAPTLVPATSGGHWHPTAACFRAADLTPAGDHGIVSFKALMQARGIVPTPIEQLPRELGLHPDHFMNVNDPASLELAQALSRRGKKIHQ